MRSLVVVVAACGSSGSDKPIDAAGTDAAIASNGCDPTKSFGAPRELANLDFWIARRPN